MFCSFVLQSSKVRLVKIKHLFSCTQNVWRPIVVAWGLLTPYRKNPFLFLFDAHCHNPTPRLGFGLESSRQKFSQNNSAKNHCEPQKRRCATSTPVHPPKASLRTGRYMQTGSCQSILYQERDIRWHHQLRQRMDTLMWDSSSTTRPE